MFDIQFDFQINFGYILGRIAKLLFLERSQKSLKGGQHSYQEGHPLRNNSNMKNLYILNDSFLKRKIADILNF